MTKSSHDTCRLCSGTSRLKFSMRFMHKYDVAFYGCDNCGSLQTEEPYWLEESYAGSRLGEDLNAVSRCQAAQLTIYFLIKLLGLPPSAKILDYGGGNGLLARMLRNIGIDAYVLDKYAQNRFAVGFEDDPGQTYDMITAFEVFEHLPLPRLDIEKIFSRKPAVVYGSTSFYTGQDSSWPYLCPNSGGHVFFYTRKAMDFIGRQFGYDVVTKASNVVFVQGELSQFKRQIIDKFVFGRGRTLLASTFPLCKWRSLADSDNEIMRIKGLTRN